MMIPDCPDFPERIAVRVAFTVVRWPSQREVIVVAVPVEFRALDIHQEAGTNGPDGKRRVIAVVVMTIDQPHWMYSRILNGTDFVRYNDVN